MREPAGHHPSIHPSIHGPDRVAACQALIRAASVLRLAAGCCCSSSSFAFLHHHQVLPLSCCCSSHDLASRVYLIQVPGFAVSSPCQLTHPPVCCAPRASFADQTTRPINVPQPQPQPQPRNHNSSPRLPHSVLCSATHTHAHAYCRAYGTEYMRMLPRGSSSKTLK